MQLAMVTISSHQLAISALYATLVPRAEYKYMHVHVHTLYLNYSYMYLVCYTRVLLDGTVGRAGAVKQGKEHVKRVGKAHVSIGKSTFVRR